MKLIHLAAALVFALCLVPVLFGIAHLLAARGEPIASNDAQAAVSEGDSTMVHVHVFNRDGELVGPVASRKILLSDQEWKQRLTPEQFQVLRSKGTERPFCGRLLDNKQAGVYTCVGCGLPLFSSDAKFHSGTGWPSFFQPIGKGNVAEHVDRSYGMSRTEINCGRCDGHLGHVFEDGPRPTGLRFCLNSESLAFTTSDKLASLADPAAETLHDTNARSQTNTHDETATAVFAGGCFWCTEAAFEQLDGVGLLLKICTSENLHQLL